MIGVTSTAAKHDIALMKPRLTGAVHLEHVEVSRPNLPLNVVLAHAVERVLVERCAKSASQGSQRESARAEQRMLRVHEPGREREERGRDGARGEGENRK